ncbi:MAG: cysteine desulfurase [Gammaproteobacteria bacterium HGW-Gammaproteobacteria-11]|nr:MAG: cysteine desulfurase [Gammaproteobacteria bacterium HGW-Gammaproteobacteria-11]
MSALEQLANQFFASLPGGASQGVPNASLVQSLDRGRVPSTSTSVPSTANVLTQERPKASPFDTSRLNSDALIVDLPEYDPSVLLASPNSPESGLRQAQRPSPGGHPAPTGSSALTQQPHSVPVNDSLAAVLQSILGESRAPGSVASANTGQNAYYFLDHPPPGQAQHTQQPQQATPVLQPASGFDVHAIRRDFPILAERVNGKPLVWFDNAATTHKPQSVIDRVSYFYAHENSNIHRAAHELAARATDAYEGARNKVTRFIGAASADEIVFVRGTTEAINLVANTFGRQHIGAGDEIIVSNLEHHANIVPWQLLAQSVGAKLRVIPVDDSGQIRLDEYARLLNPRTKLVSITQVSNALGTITPVAEVIAMAHAVGARVLVDGAQSVSHMRVNVRALDADFFVFSGHKIFGPTGIGVLYGKQELLNSLPPWQGGGNMIEDVTFEKTVFHPAPARFEAGTGNIADAVGLGAALDYVERIGIEQIGRYEHDLLVYATQGLQSIPGLRLIGTADHKASVISFVLKGYSTSEVGTALNKEGVAVRSGHHCAQPILRRFGVETTVRPSLAFYNTYEEIDLLVDTVKRLASKAGS